MQIIMSGQAAAFAVPEGRGFDLYRNGAPEPVRIGHDELRRVFDGCVDVLKTTVTQIGEARAITKRAADIDRALRLFILLLDPSEPEEGLNGLAAYIENLLSDGRAVQQIEREFFSKELPLPINFTSIIDAISLKPRLSALFDKVMRSQDNIREVRRAFEEATSTFEDVNDIIRAREQLIKSGGFLHFVNGLKSGRIDDALIFQLHADAKGAPDAIGLVRRWTAPFREGQSISHRPSFHLPEIYEPELDKSSSKSDHGDYARRSFENAIIQQKAVLDRLDAGEFDTARSFASQLLAHQLRNGAAEFAAKSLTKLSQAAKDREFFDLQLEWAELARDACPSDPRTHGQVADACIQLGQFTYARESLVATAANGDPLFAATSMARIARLHNATTEALASYKAARDQFSDSDESYHAWAGVAECLRDLGSLDDALAAYDEAIAKFPTAGALRNGRASVLLQAGRATDAIEGYRSSLALDENDIVAQNGIAGVFKSVGRLELAELRYRSIVGAFPRNSYAVVGLADTLRLMGKLEIAEALAREAVERFSRNPSCRLLLAQILRDQTRLKQASEVLNYAMLGFPNDSRIPSALAALKREGGDYEGALSTFDELTRKFPHERSGWMGRADMLRRLGRVDAASRAYDLLLETAEYKLPILIAKASILVSLGKYSELDGLLPTETPNTQDEWRAYLIEAMALTKLKRQIEAVTLLRWGMAHCPFARERRFIKSALANLYLLRREGERALEVMSSPAPDIAGVVTLHTLAYNGKNEKAHRIFANINTLLSKRDLSLAENICKNYGVLNGTPKISLGKIFALQTETIILEAA